MQLVSTKSVLENFFSQIRERGHHYEHPIPTEVKNRFRQLLIIVIQLTWTETTFIVTRLLLAANQYVDRWGHVHDTNYFYVQLLQHASVTCDNNENVAETATAVFPDNCLSLTEISTDEVDETMRDFLDYITHMDVDAGLRSLI